MIPGTPEQTNSIKPAYHNLANSKGFATSSMNGSNLFHQISFNTETVEQLETGTRAPMAMAMMTQMKVKDNNQIRWFLGFMFVFQIFINIGSSIAADNLYD